MDEFDLNEQHRVSALLGKHMDDLRNSEGWAAFKANILDEMEEGAFKVFSTIRADDQVGIIEAQQMKKVIDLIYDNMDGLVQEGRLAVSYLNNSNPDDGGE